METNTVIDPFGGEEVSTSGILESLLKSISLLESKSGVYPGTEPWWTGGPDNGVQVRSRLVRLRVNQ